MAERSYVSVDRSESPRIIEVTAPPSGANEITVQDLHDTLNSNTLSAGDPDDSLDNMDDDFLIDSAGKEGLGGNVLVGITSTLQNAQVAFEGNYIPAELGTATAAGTQTLIDNSAAFMTNDVERGAIIINFTDQSVTEVLEVLSETELRHRQLQAGLANDWTIGDAYSIFNIIQKEISGGNLVSIDDASSSISPVFPTFATQIVRTASSSATLQEQLDVQYSSYNGGVTVDVTSPYSGTSFPIGTPRQPVNNLEDAYDIAIERGFTIFYIIGDITIDAFGSTFGLTGITFIGESQNKTVITVNPSADVTDSGFTNATIQGTLDGGNTVERCSIFDLDFVEGFLTSCVLNGTITLSGNDTANILDCFSGVPGSSTPTIDMAGSGSPLALRNYNGGIRLTNKTGPEGVSIDLSSGQIILDNTVTGGEIILRGVGTWTNELTYAGGADVRNELISSGDSQSQSFLRGIIVDTINGVSGTIYPRGTERLPVNNLNDAAFIAQTRGINRIQCESNVTIAAGNNWEGFQFGGVNPSITTITVDAGADIDSALFRNCKLAGTLSGDRIDVEHSILSNNVTIKSGIFSDVGIEGLITFTGSNSDTINMISCYTSGNLASTNPTIDCGGDGPVINIPGYIGRIVFTNKTGPATLAVALHGGAVILNNTVTAGAAIISGVGTLTDNSAGAFVIDSTISEEGTASQVIANLNSTLYDGKSFEDLQAVLLAMAQGRIRETSTGSGVFEFYAQDNASVLFTLTKTGDERVRS